MLLVVTQSRGGERRTQASRRAATQTALLDATIESLTHEGWANMTTRSVAERAGVSQGAQQHYFPTKADLVDAAISRLMHQLAEEALAMPIPAGASERERIDQLLDRLWDIHTHPVNGAVFELLNLARTDADVAARLAPVLAEGVALTHAAASMLLPTCASRPGFSDFLLIAEATMRGALLAAIPGAQTACPTWPVIRQHLQASIDQLLAGTEAKSAEHTP